ncbi:MAG TPA: hypothetical protein VGC80_14780, partial [Acetobacteraceae bacterium]
MAFRPHRWFYPLDWPQISARIRFHTTGPHGVACCWHWPELTDRPVLTHKRTNQEHPLFWVMSANTCLPT